MCESMDGGYSEVMIADENVKTIVRELKDKIIAMCAESHPTECIAISYRSQVVAGTNYVVKVQLSEDTYANVMIFQPLPDTHEPCSVVGVKEGIGRNDKPEPFSI